MFLILEKYKSPKPKTSRDKWFHGTLDRHEAEKIIRKCSNLNGTYLVRYSDRNKGSTVLTVLNENVLYNYIIRKQVILFFIIFLL